MTSNAGTSELDKVTFSDWVLTLISLVFTLGGLLIMRDDFQAGIVTVSFFGACLAVFVHIILRKRRLQKQVPLTAMVAGGVPIRQSRVRIATMGIGLLALGAVLLAFGPQGDKGMLGFAWLLVAVGSLLLIGLATGFLLVAFIQFDPPGLTFGHWGGKIFVPWTAITSIGRRDLHSNQAVFLWVDTDAVTAEPPSFMTKAHKQMAYSRAWLGADFVIMCTSYALDAPVLLAALQRYITEPDSRQELHRQQRLAEPR